MSHGFGSRWIEAAIRLAKGRIGRSLIARSNSDLKSGTSGAAETSGNSPGPIEMINGVAVPPEPTYCCNSGCSNCVWIKYAQEVTQLFDNGDVIAKTKILEKVHDPKLRAFLLTQLGLNDKES